MSSLPRDAAERVLRMAIERQSRRGEHLTEREIHDIARQVGIEPEHVQAALAVERAREAALQRTEVENAVHEASLPKSFVWMAILLGLVSAVTSISLVPNMVLMFRETHAAHEYLALMMVVLVWLVITAPSVAVVIGGVRGYRRRRRRGR